MRLNIPLVNDLDQLQRITDHIFERYNANRRSGRHDHGRPLCSANGSKQEWGIYFHHTLRRKKGMPGPTRLTSKNIPVPKSERIPLEELSDKYNLTVLHARMFLRENIGLL